MSKSLQYRFAIPVAILLTWGGWFSAPLAWAAGAGQDDRQQVETDKANFDTDRIGFLVRIPLPIDGKVSAEVRRTLKQISEQPQVMLRREERPVVVLEFDTASGKTGRGSELEACMSLALYLGNADLNRIRTVAYIPASRSFIESNNRNANDQQIEGQLNGHAVLVAIAANQIAIEPDVAIGDAGIDEQQLRPLFREVYRSVANQRLTTLPVEVVLSMLDNQLQLFRVTFNDGSVEYANAEQWKELEASGRAAKTETITPAGEFTRLTGRQLADFGLVRLTPGSRAELARTLDLAPNSLEGNPAEGSDWKAMQVTLPPVIDARTVKWAIRALKQRVERQQFNLVIFNIEQNTGDVDACIRLAQYLAEYDPDKIQTVAFVRDNAQGPVGLIALTCDRLIMAPDARLGGQSETEASFSPSDLDSLRPLVKSIAKERQSDWSMMMQMLDPSLVVTRYRNKVSGQIRLLCNDELEASEGLDQWAPLGPIGGVTGLDAETGWENFLVRKIADDMGQIQTFYQLDQSPEELRPSATDRWVERLAEFLSSPFVSPWLLFAAMFFFSTEMSAPGLGLPGFLAALCFILFFWSQSLDGNADWLEVIMFIVGVVFIGMEVFVLPGFGVFGVGGVLLVISSLVLASQSFLIPRSSADVVEMSYSLLPLVGAGFGVIAGAVALRKVIPHSPLLRRMILEPRQIVDTGLGGSSDPEAIVDWSYLEEHSGETITRLNPSGKARISGRIYDVISTGQMVNKGEPVEVVEAVGNRIVVKPVRQDT